MSTLGISGRGGRAHAFGGASFVLGILLVAACSSAGKGDAVQTDDTSGAGGTESSGGDANPGAGGSSTGAAGSTGGASSGTAGAVGSGGAGTGGSGTGGSGTGGTTMTGAGGSAAAHMLPPAKGTCGTTAPAAKPVVMTCAAPTAAAPAATWANITGTLAGLTSECGNLTMISAEPCTGRVIAGVAKQGLFSTTDGKAWTKLGVTGDKILHRAITITYDPEHAGTFWESGIYGWENPWTQGVFKTIDGGTTFKGYLDLSVYQSHQDSVSVDFSDPARKTMLVGGHEQKNVLFISLDAGATFKDVGPQLPQGTGFCTNGIVLSDSTQLVGCAAGFSGNPGSILRTTDCGATFKSVSAKGVAGQPLWASDGTIYWPVEGGGMLKSTDLGLTWTSAGAAGGRPQELPDGRILATLNNSAAVTKDSGATWTPIGTALAGRNGFTYAAATKTLYSWKNDCNGAVLADAVMSSGWDYTTQ